MVMKRLAAPSLRRRMGRKESWPDWGHQEYILMCIYVYLFTTPSRCACHWRKDSIALHTRPLLRMTCSLLNDVERRELTGSRSYILQRCILLSKSVEERSQNFREPTPLSPSCPGCRDILIPPSIHPFVALRRPSCCTVSRIFYQQPFSAVPRQARHRR